MSFLTVARLHKMWPNGNQHVPGLLEGMAASEDEVSGRYKITTPLTVALMMGQFSEECGAGLEMVENMNYTAERLVQVFPTHFTWSMAQRAAQNPRMIADIAYGGRMANAPPPSDDGYNYRGRGLSQVTGKGTHTPPTPLEGYAALNKTLHDNGFDIDILAEPDLVCDPKYALMCGVADFVLCGCLPFAEKGDVLNTTKRLNGGINGLAERERWTILWRRELGI